MFKGKSKWQSNYSFRVKFENRNETIKKAEEANFENEVAEIAKELTTIYELKA